MRIERPTPWATHIRFSCDEQLDCGPYDFEGETGVYLRLLNVNFKRKQLYHTVVKGEPVLETKKTANGEVTIIANAIKVPNRIAAQATLRFACGPNELLTGLGQHENGVYDYRGQQEYLYQNNMIVAIPFLLSSAGYGLLIEAECAMRFDSGEMGFTFTLEAVDEFAVTVFHGLNCAQVLRHLAQWTGRTRLLPRWAYGYIQSRERFCSADELTATASRFREDGIGLDCLVQDWHTWRPGLWGDKTPDPDRYPSVSTMMNELHGMGVQLLVSVWPNMAKGGDDYAAFLRAGKLLPNSNTYDAFDQSARALYAEQCERCWGAGGVDGYWCDNAEPFSDADWNGELKRPEELRYQLVTEASLRSMDETRMNSYALYHAQGMYENWRKNHPEKRLVNLTRSGYTGVQQYGAVIWSGDISARWDVLNAQIAEGLKMAMSGISHWTLDIGGFFVVKDAYEKRGCECAGLNKPLWFWNGDYNNGVDDPDYRELYVRWLQFGCFLPMFRSHGTDAPREPWQFGKPGSIAYDTIKLFISLRYRLLPYVYAAAAEAYFSGDPMLRSLLVAFPEDHKARSLCNSYLLGSALLVAPVTKPTKEGGGLSSVYLPLCDGWYGFFTERFYAGGQTITVDTPLSTLPVFVKAGSIVPLSKGGECTRDISPLADELIVYTGTNGKGWLYGDTGDGCEYEEGVYTRILMTYNEEEGILTLHEAEGSLGLTAQLTIRFLKPDGTSIIQNVVYEGRKIMVCRDAKPKVT